MTKAKFKEGDQVEVTSMPGPGSTAGEIGRDLVGRLGNVLRVQRREGQVSVYLVHIDEGWYFSARNLRKVSR